MKQILIPFFLLFSVCMASGAEIYNLTLEQSIELAKEKSYQMQNLRYTLEIAQENYRVAIANQRTNISFNATLPQYNENVSESTDPIKDEEGNVIGEETYFVSRKSLLMSGNFRINQPLPTNGSVYLRTGYSLTNNYSTNSRSGMFNVTLGLSQPLDAFYGFNASRAAIKRARLALEQSEKEYKRSELDLIYSITSSYYRLLLLQKRMEIAELDLERQREAADIAAKKYEAGLIREVDALQMEVDLATTESNYDQSVLNMEEQTNSFKDLVGLNASDSVNLISDLSYEVVNIDPELAVSLALKNRLEIRENEINIEQQRLSLKQQKAEGLPTASLNAEVGKVGTNQSLFEYPYQNSLSDMFTNLSDRPLNYTVGLTVSVPILDWGQNKASVRINEARLEQAILRQEQTEREIESQVRNLISSINSNLRRLQILEKSVVVAEKSFEITQQRYADGDIDSQDMTLERNRLNSAYTSQLDAYINYQLSITDLTRQTFYDFKTNKPIE